ncbi:MAG: DUF2752 domain-containing protein [bacterium]
MSKKTKSIFIFATLLMVGVAGVSILYFFDPASSGLYPQCAFHSLTGLNCPGCGTLRALHQLAHGHFVAALHLNPLMVIALPFLGYCVLSEALFQIGGKRLPIVFKSSVWGWILVGIIIAYWILRNIPAYPFTLLSP